MTTLHGIQSPPNSVVNLTDRATQEIRDIVSRDRPGEDAFLRLGVIGGGCSGLSYSMEFSEPRSGDEKVSLHGITVLLDPKSAIYLKGITLDYQDGLSGKGFVFLNPNATNTCGCGESFTV